MNKYKLPNIKLKELEKIGFNEKWFGLCGPGDYIPEYYYIRYSTNHKYYITTNHYYFDVVDGVLKYFELWKVSMLKKYQKPLKFSRIHKAVRELLKDLKRLKEKNNGNC